MVESVPYRHFGDFLRAPVRHVNAALDVRVVFASGSETTNGDGARRYLRCVDIDWRRRTAVAQADKSARACNFHYAGYYHHEHFADPVSAGLSTIPFSAQYPDGSEMMKLVGWAQSIVTFRGGSSEMLNGVAFVFRLHLVLGMTIFLLFPFTRLVHVWSAPFEYFTRRYQIVRSRR